MRVPQRGRAILRRLSAHEPVLVFRPGDFLLTSSDGGLARLLGWATGGALNHAAVIIDPLGTVVEATPAFLADPHPFRVSSVSHYLRAGKPCWIGYIELRQGTRHDVVGYAEHLLRAQSSGFLAGRVWQALHTLLSIAPRSWMARADWLAVLRRFLDRHALVLREEHAFASGELVARALEGGGFIWDRDPAYITPADLFALFHQLDAAPAPIRLDLRRATAFHSSAPRAAGQAPITRLTPRGVQGALSLTALGEEPARQEAPQTGIQVLARVGVFMAASLAVIGLLEEAIKLLTHDA